MSETIKLSYKHRQVEVENCDLTFSKASKVVDLFCRKNKFVSLVLTNSRILDTTAYVFADVLNNDLSSLRELYIMDAPSFGICALALVNHPNPINLNVLQFKYAMFRELDSICYLKRHIDLLRPRTLKLDRILISQQQIDSTSSLFNQFTPTTIHMTNIDAETIDLILQYLSYSAFDSTVTYNFKFEDIRINTDAMDEFCKVVSHESLTSAHFEFSNMRFTPNGLFRLLTCIQLHKKHVTIEFNNNLFFTDDPLETELVEITPYFPEMEFHTESQRFHQYNILGGRLAALMINNKLAKTLILPQITLPDACAPLYGEYPNLTTVKIMCHHYKGIFDQNPTLLHLQTLDVTSATFSKFPMMPSLCHFRCHFSLQNQIDFKNIKYSRQLKYIWLSGQHIDDTNFASLAAYLPCANLVTFLYTGQNTVPYDCLVALCNRLLSCTNLERLYLHFAVFTNNALNDNIVTLLARIIHNNPFLREISFLDTTYNNERITSALNQSQYFVNDNTSELYAQVRPRKEIKDRNKYNNQVRTMSMLDYCLQSLVYSKTANLVQRRHYQ